MKHQPWIAIGPDKFVDPVTIEGVFVRKDPDAGIADWWQVGVGCSSGSDWVHGPLKEEDARETMKEILSKLGGE